MMGLILLGALTGAERARALDIRVTTTVIPGHLTLGPAANVTSPAERSRELHRVVMTVIDARGSGSGWRLEARSTATGDVAIVGIDTACGRKSTCTLPQNLARLPAKAATGRRTTVIETRKGTGMGRVEVTLTIAGEAADLPPLRFFVHAT
jgi:hypothetical protein